LFVVPLQATYLLLLRVFADPQLLRRVDEVSDYGEALGMTASASRTHQLSTPRRSGGPSGTGSSQPAWLLIQGPLFDLLKCMFVK
jgi:hypothetical protein